MKAVISYNEAYELNYFTNSKKVGWFITMDTYLVSFASLHPKKEIVFHLL